MICSASFSWTNLRYSMIGVALFAYAVLGVNAELDAMQSNPIPATLMSDFRIYLRAYSYISEGKDPYTIGTVGVGYVYPAPALLLIGLFSAIPAETWRTAIYIVLNLGLVALMLRGIQSRYALTWHQVWWWYLVTFTFAPTVEVLHTGQINLITLFGIFLLYAYADRKPAFGGLGISLAIITKFTPIIFLVYLFLSRSYRAMIWAGLALSGILAVSISLWNSPVVFAYPSQLANLSSSFMPGPGSTSLVSALSYLGVIEQPAWTEFQRALNFYVVAVLGISCVAAWLSRHKEPLFLTLALGMTILPNIMWYHHFVFLLLPIFLWMAWSRFSPGVVAWGFIGFLLIQLERVLGTDGLVAHLFAHLSILAILIWQLRHIELALPYKRIVIAASVSLISLVLLAVLPGALATNTNLASARTWVERNLPAGSRVAIESDVSIVDEQRYVVEKTKTIADHTPEWYAQNGFEYLILGRKIPDVDYEKIPQVANFDNLGSHILILKTNASLPDFRTATRFGLYGKWIELVGYDLDTPTQITLYWRALVKRRNQLKLTMRFLDHWDHPVAQSTDFLFDGPTSDGFWTDGIVRVARKVNVSSPGIYRLGLSVDDDDLGRIPVVSSEGQPVSDEILLQSFKVAAMAVSPDELRAMQKIQAKLGEQILLRGYALKENVLRSDGTLNLALYWESIAKTDKDYTVFVHLLDAKGKVAAQIDAQPRNGTYPTSIWDVGEIIRDDYALPLPNDLPSGEYKIQVGMYEYPSLTRLPIADANGKNIGDHLILDASVKLP